MMENKNDPKKFLHQTFQRVRSGGRLYSNFKASSSLITPLQKNFWTEIPFLNESDLLIVSDFALSELLKLVKKTRCELLLVTDQDYPPGLFDRQVDLKIWNVFEDYLDRYFDQLMDWGKKKKISRPLNRALFLDRDGILIKNIDYNSDPDQIFIRDEAVRWIRSAWERKYFVIVITNQSGLGRGYFSKDKYLQFEHALQKKLISQGVFIDRTYACGSFADSEIQDYQIGLQMRKPRPGLFKKAAKDFQLDLSGCLFVGDQVTDIQASFLAGIENSFLADPDLNKINILNQWAKSIFQKVHFKTIDQLDSFL